MSTKISFFILTTLFVGMSFAQEETSIACDAPPKKVVKLITKTKLEQEGSKINAGYLEAIGLAPTHAMPYYEYASYAFVDAMRLYERGTPAAETSAEKSMVLSEGMLLKAISFCEDYHANCYYYLGVINFYQKENEEALKFFKKFQNYEHKDITRYDKDHDQKLKDVKDIVDELEEEAAIYSNPVPFKPVIVPNVSSPFDEYFPMISPDNELMFYTRKYDKGGKMVEDYMYSHRPSMDGVFDAGTPFNKPFNDGSFDSYGSAAMSVDNKEMVLCACKDIQTMGQKYRNCDLYLTRYERSGEGGNDFSWTPLENLGPNINDINSWEAQPTLSPDGNMLIFAKNGAGTKDNDLFVSYRDERGRWSKAMPIEELNTPGKDKSPFLHQDSETLYFISSSTDTRKGVGGTDIFYTRKEGKKWGKPKNIGFPINTKEDEIGVFVSTDGKLAYYSSRTGGNNWNIYAFELYKEARPHAVALVKGELKDDQGNPISGGTIEVAYGKTGETEKIKINGHDGKYAAIVRIEDPQDVVLTVKKDGHSFDTKLIPKKEIEKIKAFITHEPIKELTDLAKQGHHKNHKDTTIANQSTQHVDYLHSKAALAHHKVEHNGIQQPTQTENKTKIDTNTEEQGENTVLDGKGINAIPTNNNEVIKQSETNTNSGAIKKSDEVKVSSNESNENSVLDGAPATSMVLRGVDMSVQPLQVGMSYTINNILFATSSYVLSDQSKFIIKEFSKFLLENPNIEISIQGHTDDLGDPAKNMKLSQDRSNAVKSYLVELGVPEARLESLGFGSTKPKVPNTSEENRAINRRTDFLIKKI